MYKIATLNSISQKGLALFSDKYELTNETSTASGILVRSAGLHDMEFGGGLLAIARAGAGFNNIPIPKCSEEGVVVFNTPGANANAVKELVISSLIIASRNIPGAIEWAKTIRQNVFEEVEKNKKMFVGEEIRRKTLGVIGLGYIGVMVANAAEGLGMKVVGYDPYISLKNAHDLSASVRVYETLQAMLPHCDFVTVHVPANDETAGMIDYGLINAMKNRAVLLNFSRDKLVNMDDLKKALNERKLRMYITDFPTDELIGVGGTILIPHLGASTKESEENCAIMAAEQMIDYLENGNITNSVNYPAINIGDKKNGVRVVILHRNVPAMLSKITSALSGTNIDNLINKSRGDYACTAMDLDDFDPKKVNGALDIEGIIKIRFIE
ncbi:MAG: 3-phosphoglycerate dehydrogenase [Clostridiales Family XIII bacterium]|jgi:D-3-phosphoglycerate dehydrogenase|nr:3-phosphoglycerate dehydrogenase [Clostridiales Family XIII bacterium]